MPLFSLPPIEKRVYDRSVLNIGNIRKQEMIHEDDDYIIYRLGFILRLLSLAVFVFSYTLYVMLGPDEISHFLPLNNEKNYLLHTYMEFFDYFGILFLIVTFYYSVLFYYNVDYNKHNPLRHREKGEKNLEKISYPEKRLLVFTAVVLFISSLSVVFYSSIIAQFFLKRTGYTALYDSYVLVFFVGLGLTFFVSIASQMALLSSYFIYYIFRKPK
ncbi:MAG: hypothetical protein IPH06_10750 [Alphaproteobacteria bacterium]|nr:hypothetical protein [Alphaproteobacteria bacterium]QQS58462.1 MAG: hypothetical protein IPN28_06505 [Alphaproteobacteria bacterium]